MDDEQDGATSEVPASGRPDAALSDATVPSAMPLSMPPLREPPVATERSSDDRSTDADESDTVELAIEPVTVPIRVDPPTEPFRPLSESAEGPTNAATGDEAHLSAVPPHALPPSAMPLSMPPMGPTVRSEDTPGDSTVPTRAEYRVPTTSRWSPSPPPPPTALPKNSNAARRTIVAVIVASLLAGGLGAGLGAAFAGRSVPAASPKATTSTVPSPAPGSFVSAIAKEVSPAIVDIQAVIEVSGGFSSEEDDAGTGMILTPSGEVLTNNHVVNGAIQIRVSTDGGAHTYAANVLGVDPVHDVALLQLVGAHDLPTVHLGDSASVRLGEQVVALGNALGLGGAPSATGGSISGLDRSIRATDETDLETPEQLSGLLETDAPIQPGDSGGPLVDTSGQVVGMDTAAETASESGSSTIGFAIPINRARAIVGRIQSKDAADGVVIKTAPFLGVFAIGSNEVGLGGGYDYGIGNTTSALPAGQFVEQVDPSSPAAESGIVPGDTITAVDGHVVGDDSSVLTDILNALSPGSKVPVSLVTEQGATMTVTVTIVGVPA